MTIQHQQTLQVLKNQYQQNFGDKSYSIMAAILKTIDGENHSWEYVLEKYNQFLQIYSTLLY